MVMLAMGRRSMLPAAGWEAAGGDRYPCRAVSIDSDERTSVANIKSQKKRNITNAKRAERNKAIKSELKTRVRRPRARSAPSPTTKPSASP